MDILIFVINLQWAQAFHEMMRQPPYVPFLTYPFEGVDYSELPEKYVKQHNDCYAYYLKCIRYRTDLHAVCGLNTWSGYLEEFFSPCQIDFMNCQHRMSKGHGLIGIDYTDDIIQYNGEGNQCEFYLRTAGSAEGALKMYKNSIPIIITKKELNILRKGERTIKIFKGNMNFDQNLIAKIDSMFIKEKGHGGLNNSSISNIDFMSIGKPDETQRQHKGDIPVPNDVISKIDSLFAGKGDEISRIREGIAKNVIYPEVNSVSKDKGERMIDKLILINQHLDELSLEMHKVGK